MTNNKVKARRLPHNRPVVREDYIVERCVGKRVLHIGCADAPFTQVKFHAKELLHQQIARVASQLAGLDVDTEAVAWLESQGMENIFQGNAMNVSDVLSQIGFLPEVVVAGEVLEHLVHPADFLTGIKEALSGGAELTISVPNAFSLLGITNVLFGLEKVHPEHVAYYSYYTILELMSRTGLTVVDIRPYRPLSLDFTGRLFDLLSWPIMQLRPHFAAGYVLIACVK